MARAMAFLWTCALILVAAGVVVAENIGVNWGVMSSHPLHPSIVVRLLKDNGVKKVKLFDSDSWTVGYFSGTGIEVTLGIPNEQLQNLADDHRAAKDWVKENLTSHLHDGGVNIKYVAVGNEPFLGSYNGSFTKQTFPALKNIQKALNDAGVGNKIKATIPLNADVYQSGSNKPSDGVFRDDIEDLMTQIVRYYNENGCPFTVNIYPFLSLYLNSNFPQDFAFFNGGHPINDKNVQYDNVFDANYDTLVRALKKVGVPDLKIIVGEVGWPTDGHKTATKDNAKKFYDGLFKKLASNKGTPLRPGKMEVYLFGLFDEDMKSIEPGYFERHWGIFYFDGKPKFPMDFSGGGNDKALVAAKGVQYLPNQWCVYEKDAMDQEVLPNQMSWACSHADCSCLQEGASCYNLDNTRRISYAFNSYYQTNDQDVEACKFEGLAKIVTVDPSTQNCKFPIQIVSGGEKRLSFAYIAIAALVSLMSLFILV
ncbi:glucan endo-1,3-beta-glucosidase 8-like [Durio zibethinus]|uniref:glucan endo-1,3-beta-D-glucosidase n=1 Tax=Durio zibethinus TaxID=66656 RepID=A0A6P5ZGN3_DURZI|nr:glucan endo-1,3-beta-glucosidase 8-like [Durio zibethinus]